MPLPRIAALCAISGLGGAEFTLLELVTRLRGLRERRVIHVAQVERLLHRKPEHGHICALFLIALLIAGG